VEIVAEKDVPTYRGVITKHKLRCSSTWMVGNSPKSDINPALGAGINAVFLPHGNTWILEHEELMEAPSSSQLLVVESFAGLKGYF
jgi:putative hydrolase of the HAD superfamily